VALEPSRLVDDVERQARRPPVGDPPRLLQHPPGVGDPLPSVRAGEEVTAIHRSWAQLHAAVPPGSEGGTGRGVKAAVRDRLAAVTAESTRSAREADRVIIGDLIRAVDALAARLDTVGDRLLALEALVEEVAVVTSEDLTHLRAALEHDADPSAPPGAHTTDE